MLAVWSELRTQHEKCTLNFWVANFSKSTMFQESSLSQSDFLGQVLSVAPEVFPDRQDLLFKLLTIRLVLTSCPSTPVLNVIEWLCSITADPTLDITCLCELLRSFRIVVGEVVKRGSDGGLVDPILRTVRSVLRRCLSAEESDLSLLSIINMCTDIFREIVEVSGNEVLFACFVTAIDLVDHVSNFAARDLETQKYVMDVLNLFCVLISARWVDDVAAAGAADKVKQTVVTIVENITAGNILHDTLVLVVQLSLQFLSKAGGMDDRFFPSLVDQVLIGIDSVAPLSAFNLRRIEMLLGVLGLLLDRSISVVDCGVSSQRDIVGKVVSCVDSFHTRMKLEGAQMRSSEAKPGKKSVGVSKDESSIQQSMREVRKLCISTIDAAVLFEPTWILQDGRLHYLSEQCVQSFASPRLYVTGMKAISRVLSEGLEDQSGASSSSSFIVRSATHLRQGLSNVTRYSFAVCVDLIETLQELIECSRKDFVVCACSEDGAAMMQCLMCTVISAYSLCPKRASLSQQVSWNNCVLETLRVVLDGGDTSRLSAGYKRRLLRLLAVETVRGLEAGQEMTSSVDGPCHTDDDAQSSRLHLLSTVLSSSLDVEIKTEPQDRAYRDEELVLLKTLFSKLADNVCRKCIFDDDLAQICCEVDTIGQLGILFLTMEHVDVDVVGKSINLLCSVWVSNSVTESFGTNLIRETTESALTKILGVMKNRLVHDSVTSEKIVRLFSLLSSKRIDTSGFVKDFEGILLTM